MTLLKSGSMVGLSLRDIYYKIMSICFTGSLYWESHQFCQSLLLFHSFVLCFSVSGVYYFYHSLFILLLFLSTHILCHSQIFYFHLPISFLFLYPSFFHLPSHSLFVIVFYFLFLSLLSFHLSFPLFFQFSFDFHLFFFFFYFSFLFRSNQPLYVVWPFLKCFSLSISSNFSPSDFSLSFSRSLFT